MINIENVTFKYRNSENILQDFNLRINEGETIAIVGRNGSGKSTIGKLISGIIKPKSGKIYIDDLDISNRKNYEEIRKKVGIVFQNPENQIIFNNIYDEISFSLKTLEDKEIKNRIDEALNDVEMLKYKEKDLYNLSLGQKQRVMIAEILAKHPKYIILDEPTTMIDSVGKDKIHNIIKKLKSLGYTIILITNNSEEILLADRIVILDNKKIVKEIEKEDLLEQANILEKYEVKIPMIIELILNLRKEGLNIQLNDYTMSELTKSLKGKIIN